MTSPVSDIAIVGAGAAGLAAAVFAGRSRTGQRIAIIESARRPGAKILVSGGGRCNVTNRRVTERDFHGGSPAIVRRILRAFPETSAVDFFRAAGLSLHEEAHGKLFPDSHRARDVLDVLVSASEAAGASLLTAARVDSMARNSDGFTVHLGDGSAIGARTVILATGGLSLPKTGSDGGGYALAQAFGHSVVATTPALVPLVVPEQPRLSGTAHDVEAAVWIDGRIAARETGAMLWTHFGVSGPVILDVSRHWARASLEGRAVRVTIGLMPGRTFDDVDRWLVDAAGTRRRTLVRTVLADYLPASIAAGALSVSQNAADATMTQMTREDRRRLAHALCEWPLRVTGTRGYNYAEVTAGGIPLSEVDAVTLESRLCPGLFFAGEILDVDGRLGGFNFQWAWSTGFVAGRAAADRASTLRGSAA